MAITVSDSMDYGPVPARVDHAMHQITEAHGYVDPISEMATVISRLGHESEHPARETVLKAAAVLRLAARLLREAEAEAMNERMLYTNRPL